MTHTHCVLTVIFEVTLDYLVASLIFPQLVPKEKCSFVCLFFACRGPAYSGSQR